MQSFYKVIEEKIKSSGYMGSINGEDIYDEICDEIEEKENGSYIFMCKRDDDTYFEYKIDIHDDDFNLAYLIIHTTEKDYMVKFD